MVGVLRALIIRQMTAHACVCGDVVVVVDVAVETDARRIGMRVGERESYRSVIEGRGLPRDCRVALLASLSEASGHVVRILRALKIRQVTAHARRRGDVVVVVDVAVEADARGIGVRIGQRKAYRRVIKCRRLPGDGGVALLASLRETSRDVVRVLSALKVLEMAGGAGGGRQIVVVVDMAVQANARWISVGVGQRKSGGGVIKFGIKPGVRTVALLALY